MSGRGGKDNGRGGRCSSERKQSGRGRRQGYTGAAEKASKSGLCKTLDNNVFDYGHKAAADQMRTSWEKLVQYVGATYGQDICNELQNKATVNLAEPVHTAAVMSRHVAREQMIRTGQANLQRARRAQHLILEAAVAAGTDPDAPMKLAILNNDIAQAEFEQSLEVPIELTDSEKTQYNNEWRTYGERNALLTKHRGQAFSLILG
jgi:hypothetical protein